MNEQVLKKRACFGFDNKSLKREYRKILDKVAIGLIYNEFENEKYIDATLKLARVERIIIALNIVAQIDLKEIAFLLDTSLSSTYAQKSTALKRLKDELKKANEN